MLSIYLELLKFKTETGLFISLTKKKNKNSLYFSSAAAFSSGDAPGGSL
jgi:hypothetical protein